MLCYNDSNVSLDEVVDVLCMYQNGKYLDDIKKITNLPYNVLIHILTTNKMVDKNLREFVTRKKIKENDVLIVSDTHLGHEKENVAAIDCAYDYAAKKGIHTVIHTGDLMQGTYSHVKKKYMDLKKQIEYVKRAYPQEKSIRTYILWGNHDFSLLKQDDDFIKSLKERKDFSFLGYKRSYINFNGQMIELSHRVDEYTLQIPDIKNLLKISGHRHAVKRKADSHVYVPTLSNLFMNLGKNDLEIPCFFDVYQTKDNLIVKLKGIKDYKVVDEGEVLRKELIRKKQ